MKKITVVILMLMIVGLTIVAGCTKQPVSTPTAGVVNTQGDASQATTTQATTTQNTAATTPPDNTAASSMQSSDAATPVKELKLEVYSYGFKVLNDVQIHKGDRVKITVTGTSGIHGFALPDFGVDISPISPGETKSMEFVADKSGTFRYFCNVPCGPGHSSMVGEITVL